MIKRPDGPTHPDGPTRPDGSTSPDGPMYSAGHAARRRRTRVMAITLTAIALVSVAGIGTANAAGWNWRNSRGNSHQWHPRHASQPGASPSSQSPTATTSPTTVPTGTTSSKPASSSSTAKPGNVAPPPANVAVDYQIGGPYTPPAGVQVVSRDHAAAVASGKYNICYVNAYQTQSEESSWWRSNHDDLLLKQNGQYVVDEAWNEQILDISTAAKRDGIMKVVGGWIDECVKRGYQAVEPDNLDTWTRSKGMLTKANALDMAKLLVSYAHGKGLAIGQKNAVEIAKEGATTVGFDYALAESCADYRDESGALECQGYVNAYGANVIVIEYDSTHFQQACNGYGSKLSIIQRDVGVSAPGSSSYVYKSC